MFDDLQKQTPVPDKNTPSKTPPLGTPLPPAGTPASTETKPSPPPSGETEDIFDNVDPAPVVPPKPSDLNTPEEPSTGLNINAGKPKPAQLAPKENVTTKGASPVNLPTLSPSLPTPSESLAPTPVATPPETPTLAPTPLPSPSVSTGAEDILSGVDRSQAKVKGPTQSTTPTNFPVVPPPPPGLSGAESLEKSPKKGKKLIIILVIVVGLAVVAFIVWWIVSSITNRAEQRETFEQLEENSGVDNTDVSDVDDTPTPTASPTQTPQPSPSVDIERDSDFDGITDEEEAAYGTDPNNTDTDGDGLTDRDEIQTFKTDPLNPDTDNDTYSDGEEVFNGYDPNGSGKLKSVR